MSRNERGLEGGGEGVGKKGAGWSRRSFRKRNREGRENGYVNRGAGSKRIIRVGFPKVILDSFLFKRNYYHDFIFCCIPLPLPVLLCLPLPFRINHPQSLSSSVIVKQYENS